MEALGQAFDSIKTAFISRSEGFETRIRELESDLARVSAEKELLREELRSSKAETEKIAKKNVELVQKHKQETVNQNGQIRKLEDHVKVLAERMRSCCQLLDARSLADCEKEINEAEASISIPTSFVGKEPLKLMRPFNSHIRYASGSTGAPKGDATPLIPSSIPNSESQLTVDLTRPHPPSPEIPGRRRTFSAVVTLDSPQFHAKSPSVFAHDAKRNRSSSVTYVAPTPPPSKREDEDDVGLWLDESVILFPDDDGDENEQTTQMAPLKTKHSFDQPISQEDCAVCTGTTGIRELDVLLRLRDRVIGGELGYKFQTAIRKKGLREQLEGRTCPCCQDFFDKENLSPESKRRLMKAASRHKTLYSPARTPPHFYSLNIPDTQQCKEEGYLEEVNDNDCNDRDKVKRKGSLKLNQLPREGGEDMGKYAKSSHRAKRIF